MGYPNPNESEILTIRGYFDLCLCCDEGYDDASCTCTNYTPKDVIEAAEALRQSLADAERDMREMADELQFANSIIDKYAANVPPGAQPLLNAGLTKAAQILGKDRGE
jgi:hypothetical protein